MLKKLNFLLSFIFLYNITFAGMEKVTVKIDGLTCSMCSYSVENAIRQLVYIDKFSMDLNENIATMTFRQNSTPDIVEIVEKVYEAGFSVRETIAFFNLNESLPMSKYFSIDPYKFYFVGEEEETEINGLVKFKIHNKKCIFNKDYKKISKDLRDLSSAKFTYLISIEK